VHPFRIGLIFRILRHSLEIPTQFKDLFGPLNSRRNQVLSARSWASLIQVARGELFAARDEVLAFLKAGDSGTDL
jgi:hypothetical protein